VREAGPTPVEVDSRAQGHPVRWLDEEERATWLGLLRVMAKLPAALDARLEREAGLNLFEYTVLAMLSEQPDGTLRMSRLAAVTNASPSRLSHAARQLEGRGYLVREPDPDDGRCIRAVLTGDGRGVVGSAAPGHVAAVRALVLDPLTRAQLRALRSVDERILEQVDPEGTADPTGSGGPTQPTGPDDRPDTRPDDHLAGPR